MKRKLFFDMDGTLVDFQSGVNKTDPEILKNYKEDDYDSIEGIFSLMDPMPGAIKAVKTLDKFYDCHILSTAPWGNPGAWTAKVEWIQKYLGKEFKKKVTLTHHKEFLNDGVSLLIDDRPAHGADSFNERWIDFKKAGGWKKLTEKLVEMAKDSLVEDDNILKF